MRHHSIKLDEDLEPLLSFLAPVLADKSQPSVQVFFRRKEDLVGASKKIQKCALLNLPLSNWSLVIFLVKGAFLKRTARRLALETFIPETVSRVNALT